MEQKRREIQPHQDKLLAKEWIGAIIGDFEQVLMIKSQHSSHYLRSEKSILKIIQRAKEGSIILAVDYLRVVNFIAAHLYVTNPQSRVGAINRLTLDQCEILCRDGGLECSDFKTWDTYEAQFITACPATIRSE